MHLDLSQVPFSHPGSFSAIGLRSAMEGAEGEAPGLYLRILRRGTRNGAVCRLVPLERGEEAAYACEADPAALTMRTANGTVRLCFADASTLLVRGEGDGVGLRLDGLGDGLTCNFVHELRHEGRILHMINCFKNPSRYLVSVRHGAVRVDQDWQADFSPRCALEFVPSEGVFQASLEEVAIERRGGGEPLDFETCRAWAAQGFEAFHGSLARVPAGFEETARLASYLLWSGRVASGGLFTRDAVLMSKNWMTKVWSWDHCFNAIALAPGRPDEAWDQFLLPFDHQDASGLIPGSLSDASTEFSFCKPPIHGWALSRLMAVMDIPEERLREAYERIARWTEWWLAYRDGDGDGVCTYFHGNDSGWDNASAFRRGPVMELPELSAFLVVQMDVLSDVARRLGDGAGALHWRALADRTLAAMLAHSFEGNEPKAVVEGTHEAVENDSLILYLPVLLGDRLPDPVRRHLVDVLSGDRFLTAHGYATESPASPLYEPDGYWRGPIWAPTTLLLVDGLVRCGEHALARDVALRFCRMCRDSGFAENFDALSGAGLRDRAYTWTASVFLVLAREFLLPEPEEAGRGSDAGA